MSGEITSESIRDLAGALEMPTVLVACSPELVAQMSQGWSEPVQVMITPVQSGRYVATLGATHEMVARKITLELLENVIRNADVPNKPPNDLEGA